MRLIMCLQGLCLVFVAVYQKTLSLMYVDELLGLVRDAFTETYSANNYNYEAFGSRFNKILRDCEARADAARRNAAVAQVRIFSAKRLRDSIAPGLCPRMLAVIECACTALLIMLIGVSDAAVIASVRVQLATAGQAL
jgi:hypothetical protein